MAYLTRDQYLGSSRLPRNVLERIAVVGSSVDWLSEQLEIESSFIDSRLRKRYAVPFASPTPKVVCGWLVALVDRLAYLKTGFNPANEDVESYKALAEAAYNQIEEAAKLSEGAYDLPLRQDTTASGLKRTISGTTEASPLIGARNRRTRYDASPNGKRH